MRRSTSTTAGDRRSTAPQGKGRRPMNETTGTPGPDRVASAEQIGLSAREAAAIPPPEAARLAPRAAPPRDVASWARKIDRLEVDPREGVRGTNVAGRRLTGPVQGFGKMWQKTYRMNAGPDITPEQAIAP